MALRRLRSPRTRAQLERALTERGVAAPTAGHVLDDLEESGLVDDRAFARLWVDGRRRGRGLSRSRLNRELLDRGVPRDLADEAVAELDDGAEREAADELAGRWVARHGLGDDRDRARLFAHLARRGYAADAAAQAVSRAGRT